MLILILALVKERYRSSHLQNKKRHLTLLSLEYFIFFVHSVNSFTVK